MIRPMRSRRPASLLLVLLALVVGACSGPVLANPAADRPVVTAVPSPTARPADPQPVELPRDDGPHDRLTEWWYYTGHLAADDGTRLGFEYVVFRAERGGFPVSWASHLALTDETGDAFHYAQRAEIGPQVDRSPVGDDGPTGFALSVAGTDLTGATLPGSTPWTMAGALGSALDRAQAGALRFERAWSRIDADATNDVDALTTFANGDHGSETLRIALAVVMQDDGRMHGRHVWTLPRRHVMRANHLYGAPYHQARRNLRWIRRVRAELGGRLHAVRLRQRRMQGILRERQRLRARLFL